MVASRNSSVGVSPSAATAALISVTREVNDEAVFGDARESARLLGLDERLRDAEEVYPTLYNALEVERASERSLSAVWLMSAL